VAFHLEDAGEPIANVDNACVFAWPLDHPRRLGRKFAQMKPRGFVGTMLVPHGEKIPSSVKLGVRPMRARIRAYSSGFRPCAAASSGVISGSMAFTIASSLRLLLASKRVFSRSGILSEALTSAWASPAMTKAEMEAKLKPPL